MAKKDLADKEWVTLAASTDDGRPVLNGICVRDGEMVATDGHRLHVTKFREGLGGLAEGLWNPKTFEPIEGTYPNYRQVIPKHTKTLLTPDDLDEWRAVCAASIAYGKVKRNPALVAIAFGDDKVAAVDAKYLADILAAIPQYGPRDVAITITNPLHPLRFDFPSGRVAVLMPVRIGVEFVKGGRFGLQTTKLADLPPYLKQAADKEAAAVATG